MKKKKTLYYARWGQVGHPSIANISFEAKDDEAAKKMANKLARQNNVTKTPRTITAYGGRVVEVIMTGVSD